MPLNLFLPFQPPYRRGFVRRALNWIGPTWLASPVHRVTQVASLALFLWLFFHVCWTTNVRDFTVALTGKEKIEAETFLLLDPLVSISTALASRAWVRAIPWAAGLLVACLILPRAFCGYLCPLGTLIDAFDWVVGQWLKKPKLKRRGWWVHLRYYILAGVLVAAACGALVVGFVAAIPVLTRGFAFLLGPLQIGLAKGWHLVAPLSGGQYLSVALFVLVFALSFLRPRFWCRYVCPTGAVLSVVNLLRLSERKVKLSCVGCGNCATGCPFDAIKPDFSTRHADCTFCETCGGVCPSNAITFVSRWHRGDVKPDADLRLTEVGVSRRGFVTGALAGLGTAWCMRKGLAAPEAPLAIRPPGTVPEDLFLRQCVRCGECIRACPSGVLQPSSFDRGLDELWTPRAAPDWSGCERSCNICGQVCPTGAIRALPMEEKRAARMGQAAVNEQTCLPHAGRAACQLCLDQCAAAGHRAIEFLRVQIEMDENGLPDEDSGFLAPVVQPDKCVGCGQCQARCYSINVREKGLLESSAIVVEAGSGKEDRLASGSYVALREQERKREQKQDSTGGGYLPSFLDDL